MPLASGTKIGPYKILGPLGAGGMGEVYRALDTKLNRPVAVKLLSGELADAAARRRFQREAQMASSLNHPHIVTVHDAGEFEDRQYLVTEYVDGGTLKDWARPQESKAPRSWREIVERRVKYYGDPDGDAIQDLPPADFEPEETELPVAELARLHLPDPNAAESLPRELLKLVAIGLFFTTLIVGLVYLFAR